MLSDFLISSEIKFNLPKLLELPTYVIDIMKNILYCTLYLLRT